MTKKNLKPQQAAPVQREINTTSSESGTGLTPKFQILEAHIISLEEKRKIDDKLKWESDHCWNQLQNT
jgi:prenylated cyclic peptide (anacyclamide/piricyclamide family)